MAVVMSDNEDPYQDVNMSQNAFPVMLGSGENHNFDFQTDDQQASSLVRQGSAVQGAVKKTKTNLTQSNASVGLGLKVSQVKDELGMRT